MPQSFYFRSGSRHLYGVIQPVPTGVRPGSAVLVCSPFGQEAIQGHRILRRLADALVRAGLPTMRFDYSGTGDSSGDDEVVSLENFHEDVVAAAMELGIRTKASSIDLVGVRLGGNLAIGASSDRRLRIRRVVLWDPIVDGSAYLTSLRNAHIDYLASDLALPPAALGGRSRSSNSDGSLKEALGFNISPTLVAGLRAIDLRSALGARPSAVVVSGEGRPTGLDSYPQANWHVSAPPEWLTDRAMNASLVPPETLGLVVRLVGGAR